MSRCWSSPPTTVRGAQTLEHLALLDALGVAPGLAVITKIDAIEPERVAAVAAAVADLLAPTSLAGSPVLAASGVTGEGIDAVRAALDDVRAAHRPVDRPPTLAIDRVFSVKGRGAVVTGTLQGGPLAPGDMLRLVPGEREVRVRESRSTGQPSTAWLAVGAPRSTSPGSGSVSCTAAWC